MKGRSLLPMDTETDQSPSLLKITEAGENRRRLASANADSQFQERRLHDDEGDGSKRKGKSVAASSAWLSFHKDYGYTSMMTQFSSFSSSSSSKHQNAIAEPSVICCVICTDANAAGAMKRGPRCGHYYCKNCIKDFLGQKLNENIKQMKCPESNCKIILNWEFCRTLAPQEIIERWRVAAAELTALKNVKMIKCPLCSGEFMDDARGYLIRACPKCWGLFCMRCRMACHLGMSCEQYDEVRRAVIDLQDLFLSLNQY